MCDRPVFLRFDRKLRVLPFCAVIEAWWDRRDCSALGPPAVLLSSAQIKCPAKVARLPAQGSLLPLTGAMTIHPCHAVRHCGYRVPRLSRLGVPFPRSSTRELSVSLKRRWRTRRLMMPHFIFTFVNLSRWSQHGSPTSWHHVAGPYHVSMSAGSRPHRRSAGECTAGRLERLRRGVKLQERRQQARRCDVHLPLLTSAVLHRHHSLSRGARGGRHSGP